ncbi:hypothetical protein TgHK011_007911 [Trichoderma gracile]|nr:hypothetical protein TgHK011_007911 [Trichoderma gracile]
MECRLGEAKKLPSPRHGLMQGRRNGNPVKLMTRWSSFLIVSHFPPLSGLVTTGHLELFSALESTRGCIRSPLLPKRAAASTDSAGPLMSGQHTGHLCRPLVFEPLPPPIG